MLEQAFLESLMDKAWPALEREDLDVTNTGAWVLRAAEGVTQRANSVWPRNPSGAADGHAGNVQTAAAIRSASAWYGRRRLPLIFQVFNDPRSSTLNAVLDEQRFTRQSETTILVRGMDGVPGGAALDHLELSDTPSEEWLQVWWSVDGRGGDAELDVARKILASCPSLYALVRDDDGVPAAVGRLALVDGWGGIYSMATSVTRRRRGYAGAVLDGLLAAGFQQGLEGFWLLVTAANHGAQSLYVRAGFTNYGSYVYRQAPLKRAPSGC